MSVRGLLGSVVRRGAEVRRAVLAVLAVSVLAVVLAGCGPVPPVPVAGVEFVVGTHANEPAPDLDPGLQKQLAAVIASGGPVGVMADEGTPRTVLPAQVLPVQGNSDAVKASSATALTNAVITTIRNATPTTAGADLYTTLLRAVDAARSSSPQIHQIITVDNGLTSAGPVNFTQPGLSVASPREVVKALLTRHALSADTFSGMNVEFVGLATATSGAQAPLTIQQDQTITAIYQQIITTGGGKATIVPLPRSGTGPKTTLPVPPVAPVKDTCLAVTGSSCTFGAGSPLEFNPGSAVLKDPGAARNLLAHLATSLTGGQARVTITGYTSSAGTATPAQDVALSAARGRTVRTVLIGLGVDGGRITVIGKGYTANPPDRINGTIDPAAAALNRVIRITVAP